MTAAAADPEFDDRPDVLALAGALASMPEDTVFSHRSAAQLWGLWIPWFDGIEVTTPATLDGSRHTTGVQRRTVAAHRRRTTSSDVTVRFGLPVTSLARTWLDLAPLLDIHDLIAAGDSALRVGAEADELARQVTSAHRLRGVRRARVAIGLLDERSRSRPESRIRSAIVLAGLPVPRVNEAVHDRFGGWLAEPDLHYREAKLALEFNGSVHGTVTQMRKDSTRLLGLQREGWEVRTYTAAQAFTRLDEVVADVRTLLHRRAPQLLAEAQLSRRVTYLHDQRRRNRRL
jgi:hypothetical protein